MSTSTLKSAMAPMMASLNNKKDVGKVISAAAAAPTTRKKKKGKRIITPDAKAITTSLDRRMTVEKDVVDELLLVCGVIGTTTEGDELVPVTDCLNWLQDLQRALRRDEDLYRPISLLIGKWRVVEQKLLPLVTTCRYDTAIVLTVVKILVILTKPLAENTKRAGRMIIDTSSKSNAAVVQQQIKLRENALEQAELLMEYKRIFAHHPSHHEKGKEGTGLLSIFVSLLAEPLSKSGASRTDTDHLTIELVLHLFRNLLSVEPLLKTSSDTFRSSNQLHQELITLFEKELVLEIILVVGQELELRENSQYNLLMMELLHHLLKSQDPAAVARSMDPQTTSTTSESNNKSTKSSSILASKLKVEKSSRFGLVGVRHGHFGGTWVTEQQGGKRHYAGAALSKQQQQQQRFAVAKRKNRKAEQFVGTGKALLAHSNRPATEEGPTTRRANKTLHNFCQRFVKDCYGPVMKSLKNEFRRDSVRLEESDKVVFFRLVWFFSQWWRLSRRTKTLGQVIFTMDVFTFNLVLNATDSFQLHKKQARLAQAVALYTEMMLLLNGMQSSPDSTENDIAMGLMNRLFYVNEPMDRLPKLLGKWTPGTNTREFLCDLVELCHVSLKLLEAYGKDSNVETQENNKKKQKNTKANNNVEKMKMFAAEFDVKSYFTRKIVSNQLISMYIHLLGQYRLNATNINHHVVAMFLRIARTEIVSPDPHDVDSPINLLSEKRVTLEPMLYNINLFVTIEKILNDSVILGDKDFASLISFCTNHMYRFWSAAQENPMAYVECLFRHTVPHRFCESFTNLYVSEELRMIAEREMLLEEQFNNDVEFDEEGQQNQNEEDDDDDEEVEFTGEPVNPKEKSPTSTSDAEDSDSSDVEESPSSKRGTEAVRNDGSENDSPNKKLKTSNDSDDDDDDDNDLEGTGRTTSAIPTSTATSKKLDESDDDSDDDIDFGAAGGTSKTAIKSVIDDSDDDDDDDDDNKFGNSEKEMGSEDSNDSPSTTKPSETTDEGDDMFEDATSTVNTKATFSKLSNTNDGEVSLKEMGFEDDVSPSTSKPSELSDEGDGSKNEMECDDTSQPSTTEASKAIGEGDELDE